MKKEKKRREFSKIIVVLFTAVFLWGAIVGTLSIICGYDGGGLEPFLIYMAAPVTSAVSFYFWKAKNENMIKIDEARKQKDLDKKEPIEEDTLG